MEQAEWILLPQALEQVAGVVPEHTEYRAYGADGGFLGIAQAEPETGLLRVGKNFS